MYSTLGIDGMLQHSLALNLDGKHCKQKHLNRSPRGIPDIGHRIHFESKSESYDMYDSSRMDSMTPRLNTTWCHQNGPETPNLNATFEDCKRVAAQVHCETILQAIHPVLIDLPEELKFSQVELNELFRSTLV